MTQRLAERLDLYRLGVRAAVISSITPADQESALDSTSALALGMIGNRYGSPLTSWEDDLREAVCKITAYNLLCQIGYTPAAAADVNIRVRRDDGIKWLTSVARQEITPAILGPVNTATDYDSPRILSQPSQGWQGRSIR